MSEQLSPFDSGLERGQANYKGLSPLSFLKRSAHVYPHKVAVIHGERRYTYAQFYDRCRRLASALSARGVGAGDTVSVLAPNIPEMLESHYAVPMLGAVLNAINIRLDAATVAFILEHGEAKAVLIDKQFSSVMANALEKIASKPFVVDINDALASDGIAIGEIDYESFIAGGDPEFDWESPADEWTTIALNYTSGTTGNPKGVLYHHRGAYLNAIGNAMTMGVTAQSRYLWTLPMFHCNGWTFTWGVTAVGGTHVCLREVDPIQIFSLIAEHKVTHMCGAPVVLTALIHAPKDVKYKVEHSIDIATGGAAPPSAVIAGMEALGFSVTHLYGMTECYGPSTVCVTQPGWEKLPLEERSLLMARQGVHYMTLEDQAILDSKTMEPVPADGKTMGELMLKGNTVMKGYLKNPEATEAALRGDWLHTGDLGVMHPDGYIEIKDRSKDIIISGGENISSLEVEEALYRHPDIMAAEGDVIEYCRENLAHYKCPTKVMFGDLPKTSTGKIQKFLLRERVGFA